jgi:subtilisin family serine protease
VKALSHDPSVSMIVADERIEVEAQTVPTGVSRINGRLSTIAKIDALDERVDADVAIVDTGIAQVSDLNVVGGYNCSSSNRAVWRDVYGHGTHVAGTVGALDNGGGVVGVAPGVRLWAVKILNDSGAGLLSWYVCGLDWIAAQRDPNDPSRPLIEAVNMSVAKWGSDDVNCGNTNKDILHQAICRLVASGITVVAAAGNDHASASNRVPAAYNEVITVSALADTDGKAGGKGGHRCLSWGTYDVDDTFADFSNHGSDVDLIAPGKCIMSTVPGGYRYSSGTSMAAPHVTGAVALMKASRPGLTPAEVRQALMYLGSSNWRYSTDPDSIHERLLDVSKIGPRGDFSLKAGTGTAVGRGGGIARFPITIVRSATLFEKVSLSMAGPSGFSGSFDVQAPFGFSGVASTLSVNVPAGLADGTYDVLVAGNEHGRVHTTTARVLVESDTPTAQPPSTATRTKATLGTTTVPTTTAWGAATDRTSAIGGYELQRSVDGGAWVTIGATTASVRSAIGSQAFGHGYRYRVRARDIAGNWSAYAAGANSTAVLLSERSSAVTWSGTWHKVSSSAASGGTTTYSTAAGASVRTTFSGRAIAVVAPVNKTRGSAAVYVDGVYRGTISFRSSTGHSRTLVYSTVFPTLGTHTIQLRVSGNGRVDIDAFVILR